MRKKILILVDSISYVNSEIYQQHLHPILRRKHDCTYLELGSLKELELSNFDVIFIALKLRTLVSNLEKVKAIVKDYPVIVQDYDPWVSFVDDSPYKGSYQKIYETLNVKKFVVSSNQWANFISQKSMQAVAIKLGVSSEMCHANPWENRKLEMEFRGSYRVYREKNFKRLENLGLVNIWKREFIKPYNKFLDYLSDLKIWLHFEDEPAIVDNVPMEYNFLWPKSLEILSQGCFLVRNKQTEASFYDIDKIPHAFLFNNLEDLPKLLDDIKAMPIKEKNERMLEGVEFIKNSEYYTKAVNVIVQDV